MVEQEVRIKSPAIIIKATNRRADIIGYPLILSRNCPEHLNVTTRRASSIIVLTGCRIPAPPLTLLLDAEFPETADQNILP